MQYFALLYLIIALKYCSCCTLLKKDKVTGSNNAAENMKHLIVGGNKVPPNKYPWLVTITHKEYPLLCGGAIISATSILTAAHCIYIGPHEQRDDLPVDKDGRITDKKLVSGFTIGAGATELEKPLETFDAEEIIKHPEFLIQGHKGTTDVAIIKLSRPITFSEIIKEVCLPENRCLETNSQSANIAGWGEVSHKVKTDQMMEGVNVPLWKSEECASAMEIPIAEHAICAGGKGGPTPCSGDSGGPLFVREFQKDYVIGVVSYGGANCKKDTPVRFTRVSSFLEWIRSHSDYVPKQECKFTAGYSC